MDNSIKYEIINKETKEITPVDTLEFGEGVVTAVVGETRYDFDNANRDGNLQHSDYLIREIGTHLAPNGVDKVEIEGEETAAVSEEGAEGGEGAAEGAEGAQAAEGSEAAVEGGEGQA